MKKITLLLACALCVCSGFAAGSSLRVKLTNGKTETFALSDKPAVTFSGDDMLVKSGTLTTSYSRAEIASFDFAEDVVTVVPVIDKDIVYSYHDNVFECQGEAVAVYDLTGRLVFTGIGTADLRDLAEGIYIINVNHKSIKIVKK